MKNLLQRLKQHPAAVNTCLLFASVFFTILAFEAAVRLKHFADHLRGHDHFEYEMDERLGWRATRNYIWRGTKTDAGGTAYQVDMSTNEQGFRLFGNPATEKKKIFVIGDSFTHAKDVSNDKAYYAHLGTLLDAEIFAYGVVGYGTLQEFMIADEYLDLIKPDLILLQFCSNDFANNSPALERLSPQNNSRMRRPYLIKDDQIEYILPKSWPALRNFANHHSQFLAFLFSAYDVKSMDIQNDIFHSIVQNETDFPEYKEAVKTTRKLLERLKNRANPIPVATFCVGDYNPYAHDYQTLCEELELILVPGVKKAIREYENRGEVVLAADKGHWNERGHRICAEVLAEHLNALLKEN